MNFFPKIPYTEWFGIQGEANKNIPAGIHFYALYGACRFYLQGSNFDESFFIVGEGMVDDHPEPVYRINLTGGVSVLVFFESLNVVVFSVSSVRPLSIDWTGIFDVSTSAGREETLFSQNSYSQSRISFSGRLTAINRLSEFLYRLVKAK